jgi:nitrogen regulatory protein P-II 1
MALHGDLRVKLVIAVIQPMKLNAVREALDKIDVQKMTVCDAQGFGRQRGQVEGKAAPEFGRLVQKVVLEIIVNDDFLDRTVETIRQVARSGPDGTIGDGKIFVLPGEEIVEISDGSRGPGAV